MDHVTRSLLLASLLAFESVLPARQALAAAAQPLTSCGQTVRGDYYLEGDLDCTGQPGHGVMFIGRPGRLELRGFTISNAQLDGVEAGVPLTIVGPGAIVESRGAGIRSVRRTRIEGVTVANNAGDGIQSGSLRLVDSLVRDNGGNGVAFGIKILATSSDITGNGYNGVEGPYYGRRQGGDIRCWPGGAAFRGSNVIDNGMSGDCGLNRECVDVLSCRLPAVDAESTCSSSGVMPSAGTWGVCSAD